MALTLTKDQPKINLTKSLPAATEFKVGLSWDKNSDLDASAFVLDAAGKRIDVVYYDELKSAGILHSGDVQNGDDVVDGDDETITITPAALPENAARVVIGLSIYDKAQANELTFGASANPVARLYDQNGNKLIESKLAEEAAFSSAVSFVEFTLEDGEWSFNNMSDNHGTHINGLALLDEKY